MTGLSEKIKVMPVTLVAGIISIIGILLSGCCRPQDVAGRNFVLAEELCEIVNGVPGTVGIAYVSAHDTVCVNNGVRFPMMSVFKLHEALAVIDALEKSRVTPDTILNVTAGEIDRQTWSPMLLDFDQPEFKVSVSQLITYAITVSDNNASNILFSRIVSPRDTYEYVRTVSPDTTFSIVWTESEMKQCHERAYDNYSSPLAAALLIKKVFDDRLFSLANQEIITGALSQVTTGDDRLGAPLSDEDSVFFAHKTGSGYRNERGELTAHNDVGLFRFPDGSEYVLAVFIRDFRGSEAEASAVIATISRLFYVRHTETAGQSVGGGQHQ